MDSIFGTLILFAVMIVGTGFIWKSIDNRFPKIKVDVRDRGLRMIRAYRLRGNIIVNDDLVGILLNTFKYCGDVTTLEYHTQPNGQRIYDAVLRYDFLVGVKYHQKDEKEMKESAPIVWLDKNSVIEIPKKDINSFGNGKMMFNEGVLNPMKIEYTNEMITEKAISNPQTICINFIQEERKINSFTQASNPVMAVLISSIPLLIMGGLFCLMIYLSFIALSDNTLKMLEAADKIAKAIPLR